MVWIKAEVNDSVNAYLERVQERNNCSKPEAATIVLERAVDERTDTGVEQ